MAKSEVSPEQQSVKTEATTVTPDEERVKAVVPAGAMECLAASCAFNRRYAQTQSVEQAVIYAAQEYQSETSKSEARCLAEGLTNAGFVIFDAEADHSDSSCIRELEEQVRAMRRVLARWQANEIGREYALCLMRDLLLPPTQADARGEHS